MSEFTLFISEFQQIQYIVAAVIVTTGLKEIILSYRECAGHL